MNIIDFVRLISIDRVNELTRVVGLGLRSLISLSRTGRLTVGDRRWCTLAESRLLSGSKGRHHAGSRSGRRSSSGEGGAD